jgi:hypothetical protein
MQKVETVKFRIIKDMLSHLSNDDLIKSEVIQEASPIISFGKTSISKIATMGLNPSDQEFYGKDGTELDGASRRFHTLKSLGLKDWQGAKDVEIEKILIACEEYFFRNPYDRWFKPLNYIISGAGVSFYDSYNSACHLDLVPYATKEKWGNLSERQKKNLLNVGANFLVDIINNTSIEVIVLNGRSVVKRFEEIIGHELDKKEYSDWALPRAGEHVKGEAYSGVINSIGRIHLQKSIKILGYNHNIQSSFGVTKQVKSSIKAWITAEVEKS